MKKKFQEKRTLWKEIISWVLVIAILFTSADMSAFIVNAEDAFLDFNDTGFAPPDGGASDSSGETFTDGFTDGGGDIYYEETPEDVYEEIPEEVPEPLYAFTLYLFEDTNKNGVWDEGEAAIEGINADFRNADSGEIISAMTAVEPGAYIIEGMPAGSYNLMLTALPETVSQYNLTESANRSLQKDIICFPTEGDEWFLAYAGVDITVASEFSLGLQRNEPEPTPAEPTPEPTPAETIPEPTPAETIPEPTPEELRPFTLKVFEDTNKNGLWDEGEAGIEGISADFRNGDTGEVISALTAAEPGTYIIEGMPSGIYALMLSAPLETVSLYNLTESANICPQKDMIRFAEAEEEWFLSYAGVDITTVNELSLGLQRDDLEAIEEEIANAEDAMLFSDGEGGALMAAPQAYASGIKFTYAPEIWCGGQKVDVGYYNKETSEYRFLPNYCWIHKKGDATRKVVYCVEPFVNYIDIGEYYDAGRASITEKYGQAVADKIILYAYYGADYPWPQLAIDAEAGYPGFATSNKSLYFMAAQSLIWKERGARDISWYTAGTTNKLNIEPFENDIKAKVEKHFKAPELPEDQRIDHIHEDPDKIYVFKDSSGMLREETELWHLKSWPKDVVEKVWIDRTWGELKFQLKPGTDVDGKQLTFTMFKDFRRLFPEHTMYVSDVPRCQSLVLAGNPWEPTYTWTVTVNASGEAKIKKVDDAGNPVPGVTFKWGRDKNKLDQITGATNEKGEVSIKASTGTIYIQEYQVPEHLIKDDTIKSVQIKSGQTSSVTFTNTRKTREVGLWKLNSETRNPVAGAEFEYWDKEKPEQKYKGVTNRKGLFISSVKFPVGTTIVMEEVKPAPGYEPLPEEECRQEKKIQLEDNTFIFRNTFKKIPIQIRKLNARTGEPVPGVTFHISTSESFEPKWEYTTGPNGTITTKEIFSHGQTVWIKEVACPERYILDDTIHTLEVDASKQNVHEIVLYNHEGPIGIKIKKEGSDGRPLAGVRFRLEQYTGRHWITLYDNLVSDKNGIVEIPGTYDRSLIAEGRLRLVEVTTIPGYDLLEEPYEFGEEHANSEQAIVTVTVKNKRIPTNVTVCKVDSDNSSKYLSGAVFQITDSSGRVVETLTTNRAGTATTTNLFADTQYYIEEVSPPYGYKKSEEGRVPLKLDEGNNYQYYSVVPNEPYYGHIEVRKVDQDGRGLPGIEFTIYKGYLPIETLVTNEDGYARSKQKLSADSRYRIVETYAPPQYISSGLDYEFEFLQLEDGVIESNDNYTLTFAKDTLTATFEVTNEEIFGSVTIEKVEEGNANVKVQGAVFKLTNRMTGEEIGTKTTDENGICEFEDLGLVNPTKDPTQGFYCIEEITPGPNHILPEETKQYFSLTAADKNKDITVRFENPPFKGDVEITKVDRDNPEKKLQGAEFTIYSVDDLDNAIATAETGKDGIARFEDLRYGTYIIKETKAPQYYQNDLANGGNKEYWDDNLKGYKVTISENGQFIPLTITNTKLQVAVQVIKYAQGRITKLGGAEFNLCKKDGYVLETLVTAANGTAYSEKYYADELGEGAYLIETKAPPGYEADTEQYPIVYDQNSESSIVTVVRDVENKIDNPELKFQKLDEYGNGVDATFEIGVYNESKNFHWPDQYGFPYVFTTSKQDTMVNLEDFFDRFNFILERHGESVDDKYRLTFRETRTDDYHQQISGDIAMLSYYRDSSSGWVVEPRYPERWAEGVTFDSSTLTLTAVNKNIPIKLTIVKKADDSYNTLPGAVFRITPEGQEENAVEEEVDNIGYLKVTLPYAESYLIEEIQAPPGYYKMPPRTVSISEFQKGDVRYEYTMTCPNVKEPVLKIRKVDVEDSTKGLDAEFRVKLLGPYSSSTGLETTVTTKASEDGWGTVDMSVFESYFNDVKDSAAHYGTFQIEEIKVNSNYTPLNTTIEIKFSQDSNGKIMFSPAYDSKVSISQDGREATVIVPNEKRPFQFRLKKAGEGNDSVWASIIIVAEGYEDSYQISTADSTDVTSSFQRLKSPCWVRIEETATTEGYGKVPLMGFWYYPDEEGIKKFQDKQGPITFSQDGSSFEITITNSRSKMRLYLNKTDENGNPLSGAKFRVTTESPSYTKDYVTTGNSEDEYIEFPYAENITLEEIEAPLGYELGAERRWALTARDFKAVDSTESVYEYWIKGGEPIVNESIYNLEIRKVDEKGELAEATFKVEYPSQWMTWTVPTKNGVANLNHIVKTIVNTYPWERSVQLKVTEVGTEEGLLLQTGLLATIDVRSSMISGNFQDTPYFYLFDTAEGVSKIEASSSDKALVIQVKNKPIPVNLTLIKQEEGTEKYLAGAEFEITCRGGNSHGEKRTVTTTDTAEGAKVVLPWADSYTIRETKAPKGYILDSTVHEYTIDEFEDQKDGEVLVAKNMSQTYTNTPVKGKLQITKVDEEDGNILEGAEFEIYQGPLQEGHNYEDVTNSSYTKVGTITIGQDGTGTSGELSYGEYLLKETKAPENYQLTEEIYSAEISKEDETVYVRIPNEKLKGTLTIIKQDKDDKTPLVNAVFTVHEKETHEQVGEPLVTGEDGTVSAELPYGSYYFKEVSFPSGYAPATGKIYDFTLNEDKVEVKKEIPNTKTIYALRLFKEDAETREYLAGAEFGLFNEGEKPETHDPIQRFTTRADGSAVVFLEKSGPYDIYELKAPAGYELLKDKYEVTVTEQAPTVEIVVENTKQNLNIEIHKTDETGKTPLSGAVFEIRNGKTGALVATTDQTGEDGTVSVSVPAGEFEYTVTEIVAPEGYVLDPTPRPVTINTETKDGQVIYTAETVELTNHLISGNIKLIKKDVNGEKLLEGAVFGVYNSEGKQVDTLITNSQGEAMSGGLEPGKYTLKELEPPTGYEKSETSYEAELTEEQKLIVIEALNTPKTGGFTVKKRDAQDKKELLAGAVFQAYTTREDAEQKQNHVAEKTTDANGLAVFTDLPYGTYYVCETKAPEGYKFSDRIYTVTVDENSAATVLLEVDNYQEPETGIFRVRKSDADTGAALAGAEFTVTGADVTYTKVYTTESDGTFTTEPLEPGTYTVTETKAPEGYRISEEPTLEVTVKAGDGIGAQIVEYEFTNEKIQLPIRVVKTDDSQEPKPLPGAVFELYRLGEGEEKELLETLVTDMDGQAVSTMLLPGRYEVVEVTPPVGYKLANPASQTVDITEETEPSVTEFTVTFQNSPETGSLLIKKVGLTKDETPDKNSGTPLPGAVFEAVHADTGTTYTATSDEKGEALFKELPFGIYHVKETKVPEGYEENSAFEETVLISRETAGDEPVVIKRTAYNYKQYGHVMLMKTDSETGTLVGGARYGIYTELNSDNETVNELTWLGEDYDLVSSSLEAYVTSNPLELGTYHIKERVSPPGYNLNPKIYTVTITAETPIVYIDAEDEAKKGRVTIHKVDDSTPPKPLEGAVFALYKEEDYENPPTESPEIPALYATTDAEGIAVFDDLTVGQKYVLKEFTAPDGYKLSDEIYKFTPTVDPKDDLEFTYTFENKDKKELIIHKKGENGEIISDVMFGIYAYGADNLPETEDDVPYGSFSPSLHGDGIARYDISDLPKGWYYVKETQGSMAGFVQSEDTVPFEITDETEDIEFDFINYRPRGEIEIQKKDEDGKPLRGAEFTLYYAKEGWPEDPEALIEAYKIPMDDNGHGILRDIPAGVYVLRETKVPEGYKKMPDKTIVMYLEGEEQEKDGKPYYYYYEEVVNEPISGWISVQKRAVLGEEALEGLDLSGAEFEITDADDKVVDTLITGADGKATSIELPEGTYTITETKAPAGTTLNSEPGTVIIDGTAKNDIYTYTHDNEVLKGRIRIKKVDADDPEITLAGAEFSILRDGETEPQTIVIGKNGIGTSKELPYGWYTIRETKAPEGYILNENLVLRCQIKEKDMTVEVEVENFKGSEPGDFEIIIVKHDKDNPNHYLKGAEFDLYEDEALSEKLNDKPLVTGEKGRLKLDKVLKDKLQTGITYYLKETKAPEGYALDNTPHAFTLTEGESGTPQSIALYIPNERDKGYIKFEKKGEMLKGLEEVGDYPKLHTLKWEVGTLQGAEIGIYATDEVKLDGKTYYDGELIQRLKSGETSQPLPLGTYEYKELAAPESYIPDEEVYKITLTEQDAAVNAEPKLVTIENTHASVSLTLHKRFEVEDDNTEDKLKAVKFGVYAAREITSNGITIPKNTLLGVMDVDANGLGTIKDLKLPGGPYYLMEIATYPGYVLDGKHYPFTVDYQHQNQTIEISSEENPILNEKVYGAIRLEKKGEVFSKVERLVNQEGKYQVNKPIYEEGMLKGAEVEIRATTEVTIDGKTFKPGEVVDTLISGEKDESRKLPIGTYTLVETKAPEGYLLNSDPKDVEITANTDPNKPSITVHQLENEKAAPKLSLYKSFFGKTEEEAATLYPQVLFGIYAAEEIHGANTDAVLHKDELVGLIRMKDDGTGTLKDTLLPLGKYYVRELETAEGYQISEKTYPFTVSADTADEDGEGVKDIVIEGIDKDNPVVNVPDNAKVPFAFKKVGEDGTPLAGAVFRLYTCTNEDVLEHSHSTDAENAAEGCWTEVTGASPKTSGADGIVDFGFLPNGIYQLKETDAPEGYVLPAGQWRFRVNSEAEPDAQITFEKAGAAQPPAFRKVEGQLYQYQVSNRRVRPMPFTGGSGLPGYLGGGGALVALSELIRRRRRKKK